MNLLQNLSDDQIALLGCLAALAVSGLLMSLSYYIGRWNNSSNTATHRLPQRQEDQHLPNRAA